MRVFISYTRNKDSFGEISCFRKHLEAELRSIDSQAEIIQDSNDIEEGDHYPERLKSLLHGSDVLIVHLSPSWLKSRWCRWEFEVFTANLTDTPRMLRVIPILEVVAPTLTLESLDPITAAIARINYLDMTRLRHQTWDNPEKKQSIAHLAARISAVVESSHI